MGGGADPGIGGAVLGIGGVTVGIGGAAPGIGGAAPGIEGAEPGIEGAPFDNEFLVGLFFGIEGIEGIEGTDGAEGTEGPLLLLFPPLCFNFGIPPANISPSCEAIPIGGAGADGGLSWLLLLLFVDGLVVGMEGADDGDDLLLSTTPPPTWGALLSFVSAFFNLAPFLISPSKAFLSGVIFGGCPLPKFGGGGGGPPPIAGGGGGGGGGGPAILICYIILI